MDVVIKGVRFCKVISVDDNTDADRIKVRLSPEDNSKGINEIEYAFPLLPKMFHVKPKVGEAVLVFLASNNDGNSQRYYVGPVISQDHKLYNDPFFMGADSFLRGSFKTFDEAPRMDPEKKGILPNDEDIVIRGRKNADIQITEDDIRIKAGVKVTNEANKSIMMFNIKNPAYHKIKYHKSALIDGSMSTSTIVADKINLLSNASRYSFNTTDRNDLITDEELNNVLSNAYKLPYGEKLVEILKAIIDAFLKHTHDFPMLPPNQYHTVSLLAKKSQLLDNGEMLSDTVRIN
jgi:hypothetical protein